MGNIKSFDSFNEKKWIQDAIKKPGSLKRSLGVKKGDKLSKTEIESELSELRLKDKDTKKPGTQLGKRDATKKKRLELAKTLKSFKESVETTEDCDYIGKLQTIKKLVDELLTIDDQQTSPVENESSCNCCVNCTGCEGCTCCPNCTCSSNIDVVDTDVDNIDNQTIDSVIKSFFDFKN